MSTINIYLLIFIIVFAAGSIIIEVRRSAIQSGKPFIERRKTRKIEQLQPIGKDVLDGAMDLVDEEKLKTREGMRFIIRVMQEVYRSDVERTQKINEVVEQFEALRNKTAVVFAEKYPKLSLFLVLLVLAWFTDEIRAPVIRELFSMLHINLP